MFRIRKVPDVRTPRNAVAVAEAQAIVRAQFPGMDPAEIDKLPDQLQDPYTHRFVSELMVAEDLRERIRAIAILRYDPELAFVYLDVIATAPGSRAGAGVGGALYEHLRQEAVALGARGIYFECLPDDPETSPDPSVRRQNAARLKFYERYGAFPIVGTGYQTPLSPDDTDMPFLVFDGLGRHPLPDAGGLRAIVAAILERKYAALCPPEYVARVLDSIRDGGFSLRPPRYVTAESAAAPGVPRRRIPLVVNDRHDIHHVRERGYVEAPVRISAILAELDKTDLFERIEPRRYPDRWIREVHDGGLVDYVERACREAPEKRSVYPYVFPVRNAARRPKERSVLAGYWCIDTFTPLNRNAWPAARRAADCVLTAAEAVVNGAPAAYALVRPPGHHAERRTFGGFCYICNGAVAAQYLSRYGRVAILDIDYHHGNGQQDIFYQRADVLTVSIHGDPSFAYPYFTGFRNETGRDEGAGYNINLPLPETVSPETYRETLATALAHVHEFAPAYLVLSLGLDTGRGDPTGTWSNRAADFRTIGSMIGEAGYPTVIVQEGGYRIRTLGVNARNFFIGLMHGIESRPAARRPARAPEPAPRRVWRSAVKAADAVRIRNLVTATDMFSASEVAIAEELVTERVAHGRASGYEFLLLTEGEALLGYACFGPIPVSETGWDLYWIAVAPGKQRGGVGSALLRRAEDAMRRAGARHVYVDTSSSEAYAATRGFYLARDYRQAVELPDFYRPGDGKIVFRKELTT